MKMGTTKIEWTATKRMVFRLDTGGKPYRSTGLGRSGSGRPQAEIWNYGCTTKIRWSSYAITY